MSIGAGATCPGSSGTASGGGEEAGPAAAPAAPKSSAGPAQRSSRAARTKRCLKTHVNSLWSVWYGLLATALQAYIAVEAARRFLGYVSLPWQVGSPSWPPCLELHACAALTGAAVLLLPFFLASSLLRVGNLANDGFKLGRQMAACSAEPSAAQLGAGLGSSSMGHSAVRSLWLHGGPTSPFLHIVIAILFLVPRLLMEARLIQAGFLPKESLWRPDVTDWGFQRDRLMVLSFLQHNLSAAGPGQGPSTTTAPPPWLSMSRTSPAPLALAAAAAASPTPSPRTAPLLALNKALRDWAAPAAQLQDAERWATISAEFLNYGLALLVYAVRYPAVFWHTNKTFGALFSLQLMANGAQSLLALVGASTLYKVQVFGAEEALPLRLGLGRAGSPQGQLLLNPTLTLCLFAMAALLVLASSLVLYLYGYGRLHAFLNSESARHVIRVRGGGGGGWGCFTHCAALCVLVCCCVCEAPLLHDWALLYRGSLDPAVLAAVCSCILHLLCWVVLWLLLTVKQNWVFKLRVTVGRAVVRSARSVRLVTDVELLSGRRRVSSSGGGGGGGSGAAGSDPGVTAPLLVVGNGRAYTVAENEPKKAILGVIQKSQQERKARAQQHASSNGGALPMPEVGLDGDDEQIYWLRPKPPPSPKNSPDTDRITWLNRKLGASTSQGQASKHKVTFDDSAKKGKGKLVRGRGPGLPTELDDGDYATLRELPLMSAVATDAFDDNTSASEDTKLLDRALPGRGPAARPSDYEDPSPLLTPEPHVNSSDVDEAPPPHPEDPDDLPPPPPNLQGAAPRYLRRPDPLLPVPQEDLTPRSDSARSGSTESSSGCTGSPPGLRANSGHSSSHSESSSGVHSNSSGQSAELGLGPGQVQVRAGPAATRRANSVTDLCQEPPRAQPANQWKSFSLQRNAVPPPAIPALPPTVPTIVKLQNQPIYSFGGIHKTKVHLEQQQPPQVSDHLQQIQEHPALVNGCSTGLNGDAAAPGPGGVPAAMLLEAQDSTVVIRRKQTRPKTAEISQQPVITEEPFGRSTNMRMTSFTDQPDSKPGAATLPLHPTQQPPPPFGQPHCATLPAGLPAGLHGGVLQHHANSCGNFALPQPLQLPRPHTTIPTHHNGVRLFHGPRPQHPLHPLQGRYGNPPGTGQCCGLSSLSGHPNLVHGMSPTVKYGLQQHLRVGEHDSSVRDSVASSGDGEYAPHCG